MGSRARQVLLALFACASSGCFVLVGQPDVVVSGTGRPLFDKREDFFVDVGKTTRAEMLLQLGQPFWVADDGAVLVYAYIRSTHNVVWMIIAPIVSGTVDFELYLVQFDSAGQVSRTGFRSGKATWSMSESLDARRIAAAAVAEWIRQGAAQ